MFDSPIIGSFNDGDGEDATEDVILETDVTDGVTEVADGEEEEDKPWDGSA